MREERLVLCSFSGPTWLQTPNHLPRPHGQGWAGQRCHLCPGLPGFDPGSGLASAGDTQHMIPFPWASGQAQRSEYEVREVNTLYKDCLSYSFSSSSPDPRSLPGPREPLEITKRYSPSPGQTHPVDLAWDKVAAPRPLGSAVCEVHRLQSYAQQPALTLT